MERVKQNIPVGPESSVDRDLVAGHQVYTVVSLASNHAIEITAFRLEHTEFLKVEQAGAVRALKVYELVEIEPVGQEFHKVIQLVELSIIEQTIVVTIVVDFASSQPIEDVAEYLGATVDEAFQLQRRFKHGGSLEGVAIRREFSSADVDGDRLWLVDAGQKLIPARRLEMNDSSQRVLRIG